MVYKCIKLYIQIDLIKTLRGKLYPIKWTIQSCKNPYNGQDILKKPKQWTFIFKKPIKWTGNYVNGV